MNYEVVIINENTRQIFKDGTLLVTITDTSSSWDESKWESIISYCKTQPTEE